MPNSGLEAGSECNACMQHPSTDSRPDLAPAASHATIESLREREDRTGRRGYCEIHPSQGVMKGKRAQRLSFVKNENPARRGSFRDGYPGRGGNYLLVVTVFMVFVSGYMKASHRLPGHAQLISAVALLALCAPVCNAQGMHVHSNGSAHLHPEEHLGNFSSADLSAFFSFL